MTKRKHIKPPHSEDCVWRSGPPPEIGWWPADGTVAHGPYIAPGDWMLPWVRNELALWFRRPAPLAPPMCRR